MVAGEMIELCAVGDISPGDHYFLAGCGVASTFNARDPNFLFEKIKPLIEGSDITFANLEGVLSYHGLDTGDIESVSFRGSPKMATSLSKAGFTILNIANNHILQHGRKPFEETVELLEQNRITPLGLASSNGFSSSPVYLEIGGFRIGFLGYSLVTENYCPKEKLYASGPVGLIIKDILKLSEEVDYTIVSLHHGLEGINRSSPYESFLSRMFIDAGAKVVLGHHSHVFQAVEIYKEGIICHSLGNFLFDLMWYAPLKYSAVLKIRLWPDRSDFTVHPLKINRHFQPTPLEGEEKTIYQLKIDQLNNFLQVVDYEMDSYKYYTELRAVQKYLVCRKLLFFFIHIFKGNCYLKIQFILRKIRIRIFEKVSKSMISMIFMTWKS